MFFLIFSCSEPDLLVFEKKGLNTEDLKGEIKYMIEREQVGLTINELLVVEYYSRK